MFSLAELKSSYPRILLSSMTFTPTTAPDMENLSVSVTEPEMMLVGDVEDVEVKVTLADGTLCRINGYKANREPDTENYLTVSSGNSDVASLTGTMTDGVYSGKLTAQGAGETTLNVTGKICGNPVSAAVPVKAIVPAGPVKMTIDMTKNSIVYTDQTAPSAEWQTTGFDIVFDKTTTCKNSRYTPHVVNGTGIATVATSTGAKSPDDVWPASTPELSRGAMFTVKKRSYGEGYYAVYVQGGRWYANSDYAIYVNGHYAGDYNFHKADANNAVLGEKERLNTVYLPAGDVEISFRVRQKFYDVPYFQPYLVELVPVEVQEAPYAAAVESNAPETIYVGESADITAKVLMSDGSYRSFGLTDDGSADTASCVTSVTSADTGVATVSDVVSGLPVTSDEITFTVNAEAKGETKALVAINIAGQEPCVKEIPIKVIEKPKLSKVDLAFSVNQIPVGNVGETSVTLTREDESAWPEADSYEVVYESLTPEYALINPETGVVTGVSVGTAEIKATVTAYDGTVISGTATIEITPELADKSVTVDFTTADKIGYSKDPAIQTTPRQVKGKGFAAVAAETTEKSGQGSAREFNHTFGVELIGIETKATPWLSDGGDMEKWTVEVNLGTAKPGWYSLSFLGGKWSSGASWYIYADGQYAGFYDSFDASVTGVPVINPDGETKLNSIYLTPDEAGKVKVMFALAEAVKNARPYILLSTMTFKPVNIDESKTVILSTVPNELVVGEKNVITARIILSDGTERLVNGYAGDRSADTSNCILASVEGSSISVENTVADEAYLGKVSVLSDGNSTVTLKAVINGNEVKTETYSIPVRTEGLASTGARPEGNGIGVGETGRLVAEPRLANGRILSEESVASTYRSLDAETATVEGDIITAKKAGTVDIEVTSIFNGEETVGVSTVTVFEGRIVKLSATSGGSQYIRLTDKENDTAPVYVTATDHLGKEYAVENENISSVALTKDIADVDAENNIIPKKVGEAEFEVTVDVNGSVHTERVTLPVVKGKSKATYRPESMVQAARENYKKYDWVKSSAETYIKAADKYVSRLDDLYNMIASQGIPRSHSLGAKNDPEMYTCRFCNADLMALRGQFPWVHNALSRPWKVQCPECKRVFPSNDFEKFYELGLNEYREFDRMRALEAHRELFGDKSVTEPGAEHSAQWKKYYGYGVPGGYLTNNTYESIPDTANGGRGLREGETVQTWGVDDSMGYVPAKADGTLYEYIDENGNVLTTERHIYIAEYMHTAVYYWISGEDGAVSEAIRNCALAYFYTGDKQYGRVAAILLDRIADFYHEYDISAYGNKVWNADGGAEKGKMTGRIWESGNAVELATAYDIVFDMYEDEYVLNYIKEKSNTIKMRHAKNTAS
ncbi:MAG: Ig-like domain-containing protein, partial [Oscillospiraceae bacterium]|nr:Ig-like domain-containing protein [Oscillospiraceae bacterium]